MVDSPETDQPCQITAPYLLALNAGILQAPDGSYWTDRSWAKDLMRHTTYISNLTFFAPIRKGTPPTDYIPLPPSEMRVVGYPNQGGRLQTYLGLPYMAVKLLGEIRKATVIHTCVAGYPFPLGWIAIPIARLLGKKVVVTVESSFWRIPVGKKASYLENARANFWEFMNRYCLRQADYAAYPHDEYRQSLPSPRAGGGVLFQASWIEDCQIATVGDVHDQWSRRLATASRPKFVFAARMVKEKGTQVLVEAIKLIEKSRHNIQFDVIGAGPELENFRDLSKSEWGREHVKVLEPIPYGPEFFTFLRDYDAVISPGLSDEQPRIVYDAYAGGVPSIASDMPGLTACISDGVTGRIVPAGNPIILADTIVSLSNNRHLLASWGKAGRDAAVKFTHDQMHIDRCIGINQIL